VCGVCGGGEGEGGLLLARFESAAMSKNRNACIVFKPPLCLKTPSLQPAFREAAPTCSVLCHSRTSTTTLAASSPWHACVMMAGQTACVRLIRFDGGAGGAAAGGDGGAAAAGAAAGGDGGAASAGGGSGGAAAGGDGAAAGGGAAAASSSLAAGTCACGMFDGMQGLRLDLTTHPR